MNKLCHLLMATAACVLVFAPVSFGATIGDLAPATQPTGPAVDGYTGGVYADSTQTFGMSGTATSVTFNAAATSAGNELTFMVGTFSGTQFTPSGIFNDLIVAGGLQTVDLATLGIASGTAAVTSGETFGWTDQTIGSSFNGGSIFYGSGPYSFFTADANQNESPVVGAAVGNLSYGGRDYSVNFTVVPEPSSLLLAGVAMVGLLVATRRRRKA